VPAGALPYSHPGELVWEWVVPRDVLGEINIGCDFHPEFGLDTCFEYFFMIPNPEWFYQIPGPSVYWLTISAIYTGPEPDNPWGWKTREHYYNDAAIRITDPTSLVLGSQFVSGMPVENPETVPWDLAYEILTDEVGPTPTPLCPHTGDVIADGIISAGDAQRAFYIVVGLYTPNYIEECAADCNGDGVVSAGDAQQIFGAIFGGSCADPLPPKKQSKTSIQQNDESGNLVWLEFERRNDALVVKAMMRNETETVDAFTLNVHVPENAFKLVDFTEGSLEPDWIQFDCREVEPGVIRVAGYSLGATSEDFIDKKSYGSLVELKFALTGKIPEDLESIYIGMKLDDIQRFDVPGNK